MAESRRQKILYVVTKSVWGGAQRYVFDLSSNLPRDRFEVAVVAGGSGPLTESLEKEGVRTIVLPTMQKNSDFFDVVFSRQNFRLLKDLYSIFKKENPDVIHLNSSKIGGVGAVAAFIFSQVHRTSPKVVFTAHGWGFKEDRPFWQKSAMLLASFAASVFQNDVILINTADYKAAKKFIPGRKLHLIFNGLEAPEFMDSVLARSELAGYFPESLGRQETLVGTIAELTKNKGLDYLIEALGNLGSGKSISGIIMGEGQDRMALEAKIKEHGLEGKVCLPGFVEGASSLLGGLDVFVLPSLKEGLPYVVMEAMHAGVPVVATRVGGIPDLIEHEKEGILVDPKDARILARAVERVIGEDGAKKTFGGRAQKKIKAEFTLEQMLKKTIALYGRDTHY